MGCVTSHVNKLPEPPGYDLHHPEEGMPRHEEPFFPDQPLPPEWSSALSPEVIAPVLYLAVGEVTEHVIAGTGCGSLVWLDRDGEILVRRKIHDAPVRVLTASHFGVCSGCEVGSVRCTGDFETSPKVLVELMDGWMQNRVIGLRILGAHLVVQTTQLLIVIDMYTGTEVRRFDSLLKNDHIDEYNTFVLPGARVCMVKSPSKMAIYELDSTQMDEMIVVNFPTPRLVACWQHADDAYVFILPSRGWSDQIQKWHFYQDGYPCLNRVDFQCKYGGECFAMDTAGNFLFLAGTSSVQQICASTGQIQRAFLAADTGGYVDAAIIDKGRLILGSGPLIQLFTAFCMQWSRETHHKFPPRSRAAVVVMILMNRIRDVQTTWPDEQVIIELIMDGLAPILWDT